MSPYPIAGTIHMVLSCLNPLHTLCTLHTTHYTLHTTHHTPHTTHHTPHTTHHTPHTTHHTPHTTHYTHSHSTDSSLALSKKCSLSLLSSHLLPMCVGLGERAMALWHFEQLLSSNIASAADSGIDTYTEELVSVCVCVCTCVCVRVCVCTCACACVHEEAFLNMHTDEGALFGVSLKVICATGLHRAGAGPGHHSALPGGVPQVALGGAADGREGGRGGGEGEEVCLLSRGGRLHCQRTVCGCG